MNQTSKPWHRKYITGYSFDQFRSDIKYFSEQILHDQNNIPPGFEYQYAPADLYDLTYNYLIGVTTKWDHRKNLLLMGSVGVGKTLFILALMKIIQLRAGVLFDHLLSYNLMREYISRNGWEYYERRPLFLNDIGKELRGQPTHVPPLIPLIDLRYLSGAWTFIDTNYNFETITELYGKFTSERIESTFNVYKWRGDTRRKINI